MYPGGAPPNTTTYTQWGALKSRLHDVHTHLVYIIMTMVSFIHTSERVLQFHTFIKSIIYGSALAD